MIIAPATAGTVNKTPHEKKILQNRLFIDPSIMTAYHATDYTVIGRQLSFHVACFFFPKHERCLRAGRFL
jgi:hypothetical protein